MNVFKKRSKLNISQNNNHKHRNLYELFQCKTQPRVSIKELFKYSNWLDRIMICLGLFGTVLMCQGWCICTVLLGETINIYHDYDLNNRTNHKHDHHNDRIFEEHIDSTINLSLLSVGLYFIGCLIAIYTFKIFSIRLIERIKIRFYKQILKQNIAWHEQQNCCEITSRIVNDFKLMQRGINSNLAFLFYRLLSAFLNVLVSLWYGWEITLLILCGIILAIVPGTIFIQLQSTFVQRFNESFMKANTIVEQTITSIRTVFAYGGEHKESLLYEKMLKNEIFNSRIRDICIGLFGSFNWLFICIGLFIGIQYGLPMIYLKSDEYSIGTLVIIFLCLTNFSYCLIYGISNMEALQISRASAAKIYQTINLPTTIDGFCCDGWQLRDYKCDIEFKNVYFQYPSREDNPVLNDINLKIYSGESVALVGPSGCGKSTLLHLIQRFYDVIKGEIIVDETRLKELNVGWWRTQIGSLNQETTLFDLTIEQNIRLGLNGDEVNVASIDRVIQASKDANAHEFITRLPDGYNTLVGNRGYQLSCGQKQRIAVARTLIGNPKILLLDEVTTALDVKSEQFVQNALYEASKNRTTIMVTHRLSTIRNVDRIIVMDNGCIVQIGTHDSLLLNCELYRRLVRAQQLYIPSNASQYSRYLKLLKNSSSSTSPAFDSFDYEQNIHFNEYTHSSKESFPYRRLWSILSSNKYLIFIGFLCSTLYGLGTTFFAFFMGNLIDQTYVLNQQNYRLIQEQASKSSYEYMILGIFGFILNIFQVVIFGKIIQMLTAKLRIEALRAILKKEMSWFDNEANTPGTVCSMLTTNATNIHSLTGLRLSTICKSSTTLLSSLIISCFYSYLLSLTMLISLFVVMIFGLIEAYLIDRFKRNETKSCQSMVKIVSESLNSIGTIVLLHKEKYFLERFCLSLQKHSNYLQSKVFVKSLIMSIPLMFQLFIHCLAFIVGKEVMLQKTLKSGQFLIIIQSMLYSSIVLYEVTILCTNIMKAKHSILSLFSLIDSSNSVQEQNKNDSLLNSVQVDKLTRADGNITFHKVDFSYPTRSEYKILRGLSFHASKGQTIALVGSSGSGKTTTIQLLERFYVPSKGIIKLDDKNIAEVNRNWLRSQISLVSEDPILLNYSIEDNIAYGAIGHDKISHEDVLKAANQVNITEFIQRLPNKFRTKIDRNWNTNSGIKLTFDQILRISLARALIRNPPILLLDEVTLSLDKESEMIVQNMLDNASKDRTCIVITHRLRTIVNADKIIVIHNGRCVEQGTHRQLLSLKGHYYRLFQSSL